VISPQKKKKSKKKIVPKCSPLLAEGGQTGKLKGQMRSGEGWQKEVRRGLGNLKGIQTSYVMDDGFQGTYIKVLLLEKDWQEKTIELPATGVDNRRGITRALVKGREQTTGTASKAEIGRNPGGSLLA